MTAFDRVVSALEAHGSPVNQHGDDAMVRCPAHEDRNPSLSVRRVDGKVLVNCHAGCDANEVIAALGLTASDLFDEKPKQDRPQIVATYDYTDENGVVLFQKVRWEPGWNGERKTFHVRRPDGHGGYIKRIGDTRRVLYRLPEVRAAITAGKTVWIVEGEKDADRVARDFGDFGTAATCNFEGAALDGQRPKWRRQYTEQLRGATKIVVVADNDPPGYAHAHAVAAALRVTGAAVQVVRVAVDRLHADLSDHLNTGHGLGELVPLDADPPGTGGSGRAGTGAVGAPVPDAPTAGGHSTDGAGLLDKVAAFIRRFVVPPDPAALVAMTLWVAHTHLVECFETTPRLAFLSPEPGSGKSRAQEVIELLVPAAMHVLNASPAAIFRTIQVARPTLLLDEVDTIFTRKGKDDEHADLRGLLNSGHRAGATIPRCVGPRHDVESFPTFCAVCLAGLGDLPATLMTRSVVVRMRRRAPRETVEPFRRRLHRADGEALRDRLEAWAKEIAHTVTDVFPELPAGVTDRPADVWEPLLAVADAAGGEWPGRARTACTEMIKAGQSTDSGSLGVRLLRDLRTVFGDASALHTETILNELHKIEEGPWADLRGQPLDARGLAYRLRPYDVKSTKVKIAGKSLQGYQRADLWDAWQRYVPPVPAEAEPPEPEEPRRSGGPDQVPDVREVPEPPTRTEPETPPLTCDVPEVPEVPDLRVPERDRWLVSGDPADHPLPSSSRSSFRPRDHRSTEPETLT